MWIQSLGREDPLQEGMATNSSILACRIPCTEEPGRLQSIGSQRIRYDRGDLARIRFIPWRFHIHCSVTKSCPTLCDSMNCSTPGFSVLHCLPEFAQKLMSSESVMPSNRLILCCPLLLPPAIFPSIRVFSNKSALSIR